MSAKKRYRRTHRHRANQKLRNTKAVRAHTKRGGRTGMIWQKRTHSTKAAGGVWYIPNATMWWPA